MLDGLLKQYKKYMEEQDFEKANSVVNTAEELGFTIEQMARRFIDLFIYHLDEEEVYEA